MTAVAGPLCSPHLAGGVRELPGARLVRALVPFTGPHAHDVITSQRRHPHTPSGWMVRVPTHELVKHAVSSREVKTFEEVLPIACVGNYSDALSSLYKKLGADRTARGHRQYKGAALGRATSPGTPGAPEARGGRKGPPWRLQRGRGPARRCLTSGLQAVLGLPACGDVSQQPQETDI